MTFTIILIMSAVTLFMFWIPISAAEKPKLIMKQSTAEKYLIAQENSKQTLVSKSNSDETLDVLINSKPSKQTMTA